MLIKESGLIIGGYFLGAIPFGVLIAHFFYHVNIRQQGSRNTGATLVLRRAPKRASPISASAGGAAAPAAGDGFIFDRDANGAMAETHSVSLTSSLKCARA